MTSTLLWHGPEGSTTCRLRPRGPCAIFQEESAELTSDDLHGLPVLWDEACACAELACGHTFHVSAIALHFLANDMRCPVCRQGHASRMLLESLPPEARGVFRERAGAIADGEAADSAGASDADTVSDNAYDSDEGPEDAGGEGVWPRPVPLRGALFACMQAQLRLVAEVTREHSPVSIFQSRLHCRHAVALDLQGHRSAAVFHDYYVQRTFCRHVLAKIERLAQAEPGAEAAVMVRFSLSHPLLRCDVHTGVFRAGAVRTIALVADTPAGGASGAADPWPSNVGSLCLDHAEHRIHLALQSRLLLAFWGFR